VVSTPLILRALIGWSMGVRRYTCGASHMIPKRTRERGLQDTRPAER
jgi:hypothetical protein